MASVRGFRCGQCRAEMLATSGPGNSSGHSGRPGWVPPVLCCGEPLRSLESDQVLFPILARNRIARCPRCGCEVRVIIHPAGPLVCTLCQTDLVVTIEAPGRTAGPLASAQPVSEVHGSR